MKDERELKLRRLRDLMAQSIQPPETASAPPMPQPRVSFGDRGISGVGNSSETLKALSQPNQPTPNAGAGGSPNGQPPAWSFKRALSRNWGMEPAGGDGQSVDPRADDTGSGRVEPPQSTANSFRNAFTRPRTTGVSTSVAAPVSSGDVNAGQAQASVDPRREFIYNKMRDSLNPPPVSGSNDQPATSFRELLARQADRGGPQQDGSGQTLTPTNQDTITRPRRVGESSTFRDALARESASTSRPPADESFGSSGEPFRPTRERRTQPRDSIADDEAYLRDLENQPRNWKDKTVDVIRALNTHFNGPSASPPTKREREIAKAQQRLGIDLEVGQRQAQIRNDQASAYDKLNKPPTGSTRIIDEGEYPGIPAGTEIRQVWNGRDYVDDVAGDGRPRVSKAPPAERAAAREIKYNRQGHAVLVSKDGSGKSSPIFEPDGVTPLTKERNETGNVQTAYRLEPDGITQIQIERDGDTGEWVDSVGRDKKPIVRGTVGRIDSVTGAPISALIADNRITTKENQENARKHRTYDTEAQEWGGKEKSFRQNKSAEDTAINTKTAQLQSLYNEQPGGTLLNRNGRTKQAIDTDIARLKKEIDTHRENAKHFQTEADKAAGSATAARRNAGLSRGSQEATGQTSAGAGRSFNMKGWVADHPGATDAEKRAMRAKAKARNMTIVE